eukprot:GHVQ01006383.1.p1 GENE.GHVQ01006383.1~~GHVQ01006383.1.p1  ORF type:complete len:239 (-),score=30.24 GHVQ01006383.1:111-827(-)
MNMTHPKKTMKMAWLFLLLLQFLLLLLSGSTTTTAVNAMITQPTITPTPDASSPYDSGVSLDTAGICTPMESQLDLTEDSQKKELQPDSRSPTTDSSDLFIMFHMRFLPEITMALICGFLLVLVTGMLGGIHWTEYYTEVYLKDLFLNGNSTVVCARSCMNNLAKVQQLLQPWARLGLFFMTLFLGLLVAIGARCYYMLQDKSVEPPPDVLHALDYIPPATPEVVTRGTSTEGAGGPS